MELFQFIFRLGVVFAIFGFIWGLIDLMIMLISSGRQRQVGEIYIIKAVKYFFLVDVTFLICVNGEFNGFNATSQLIFGTIVLLMYFVGKLQNSQNKQRMFQMATNGIMRSQGAFNMRFEIGVIIFALTAFVLLWLFPIYAENPMSLWFQDAIINIEDTPIFGFIFKVIGFFFLMNIVFKMVNAFLYLLSGQAFQQKNVKDENDRNDFDSFEEIE